MCGATKIVTVTRNNGSGLENKNFELKIEPGMIEGDVLTFPGDGDSLPKKKPQDLIFELKIKSNPELRRDGADLHYTHRLPFADNVCGKTICVPELAGEVRFTLMEPVESGTVRRFPRLGLPKNGGKRGELIVTFEIIYPR
ncbi:unnamed protein product [Caenorhabditis auriculariae]|uniref:Chaperone DnaJ C-terminal domain-containing protein n=1 Tax=Caenorhabditis auriculariae TaxID=2777116 RepID=A0A8S1GUU2_9PELO|nr:unnamed protein product [Caenorhabditis auriculariae]